MIRILAGLAIALAGFALGFVVGWLAVARAADLMGGAVARWYGSRDAV